MNATGNSQPGAARIEEVDGGERIVPCDYLISTMPVRELVEQLGEHVPAQVRAISDGLQYRDFITVGVLLRGHTRTPASRSATDPPARRATARRRRPATRADCDQC